MLARFEHALQIHEAAVALDEIAVDLGRNLARLQQPRPVHGAHLAVPGSQRRASAIDLIARNVAAANLLDDAVALQREKQKADRLIDFITAEILSLRHVGSQ